MSRSQTFAPEREPLRAHKHLNLRGSTPTGPFSFSNPTRAHYSHNKLRNAVTDSNEDSEEPRSTKDGAPGKDEELGSNVEFKWRSRDNRKGRHALIVEKAKDPSKAQFIVPKSTHTLSAVGKGILRMFIEYPYWNVSWWVAIIFTIGSIVWVINAFFVWLPIVDPSTEFPDEIMYGGGITAFLGATIFEIGSILLMVEAINENREGCFGWAIEQALASGGDGQRVRVKPDKGSCSHHHTNKKNFVGKGDVQTSEHVDSSDNSTGSNDEKKRLESSDRSAWQWWPSWHDLTSHYLHELGFLACLSQLFGASVFWISGFTALPGVNNVLSQGALDGIYWTPQIVGGSGFIVSSIFFMLETQKTWYIPAPKVLGWHIGVWNLVGAFGFTLCGALGPAYLSEGALYQSSLATFWGSWAFLIASIIQWYECLDTHPVEEKGNEA